VPDRGVARTLGLEIRTGGRASGTVEGVIFDFRYKDAQGKWKALGHRKGLTRDTAFASLEERVGPSYATEFMSRPRDGRTRKWDLFRHPDESL